VLIDRADEMEVTQIHGHSSSAIKDYEMRIGHETRGCANVHRQIGGAPAA
jgi:hypothetical protein